MEVIFFPHYMYIQEKGEDDKEREIKEYQAKGIWLVNSRGDSRRHAQTSIIRQQS